MKKRTIKFLMGVGICILGIGVPMAAMAETTSRRERIKSKGNITFGDGKVSITSSDLTYLADEIDNLETKIGQLENTYKTNTIEALNSIGTYFREDGTTTIDASQNGTDTKEKMLALSYDKILEGIRTSQSIKALFSTQAMDEDGNPVFFKDENAWTIQDRIAITTENTGYPLLYQATNANNLSVGTAAWVDGILVKGNGADNAAYREQGYREGYTMGFIEGQQNTLDNINIQYTYHEHAGTAGSAPNGCYTTADTKITGYHSHNVVGTNDWHETHQIMQCTACYKWNYDCNIPKYWDTSEACLKRPIYTTTYSLGCGKTTDTIESVTILY